MVVNYIRRRMWEVTRYSTNKRKKGMKKRMRSRVKRRKRGKNEHERKKGQQNTA